MLFHQTSNTWMFAMFENFIHSQLLKPILFVPEPLWNSDKRKLSNFRIDFFCRRVISPFAMKLFLLPFTSNCSTQNIGFRDSGYVIKPPQLSSAVHGAPPYAGDPNLACQISRSRGEMRLGYTLRYRDYTRERLEVMAQKPEKRFWK